jgi:hypothetical protein
MIRVKSTHEYGVRSQADNLLSESGSPQDTSRCATYLFGFAEPSGAPYQQQGPRYPATSCDGQCRSGLNTSVLPRARLEYHVQPQQTGGDYKNTCLKIMVDALTSGSTFFDQSACQIKSGSGYKSRYRDRRCDAYQWNEFTEQDTGHQKCENDCGKRNGTGLPANYDRSAHFPFLGLKHRSGDSRTKFFKQDVHLQKCI